MSGRKQLLAETAPSQWTRQYITLFYLLVIMIQLDGRSWRYFT
jgi:hypothetical protein